MFLNELNINHISHLQNSQNHSVSLWTRIYSASSRS